MENNKQQPIGVFDSGIGGLTAMKELIKLLPNEDIIYFGDTARVPYGTHTPETIVRFAKQDLNFLLQQNVKAVLIACGTASSTALGELKKMTDIPILGVIEAAARKSVEISKNKKVLVLSTPATTRSHAYNNAINRIDDSVEVVEKACPLFVPLVENGYVQIDNPVTKLVVKDYLGEVSSFGADAVILGCTHYPLIKDAICDFMPDIQMVEAGKEAAIELSCLLEKMSLKNDVGVGKIRYVVSEKTESFKDVCEFFLGRHINETIENINLDDRQEEK